MYLFARNQLSKTFLSLHVLPDFEEGVGPLEGLLSAFREAPLCAWLAVVVDMAFLPRETLHYLVQRRDPSAFATAYRNPETDRPEPVCTIYDYEPRVLPVLQEAKRKRWCSLMLLRGVPIRLAEPMRKDELKNINDLNEYRKAGGISFPPIP
jgi:molybdopterin-guanine dinucleotide biosynthesis protein A